MKIDPYKLTPTPPRMAVLANADECLDENGDTVSLYDLPKDLRVFASHEHIWDLLYKQGKGEALCWDNQPIKWRPRKLKEPQWAVRNSDVRVFRNDFPLKPATAVAALAAWRDWLARYGAAPQGSLGGSAWSLLRGTLTAPLWTNQGDLPPIRSTLGGRMETGPGGPGYYAGNIKHLDMPSAYANVVGNLHYGGWWTEVPRDFWKRKGLRGLEVLQDGNHMLFVRASVTIPDLTIGPLPKRPRGNDGGRMRWFFDPISYPVGRTMQGTWTWPELVAAMEGGCKVRVLAAWVHLTDPTNPKPFAPWLEAVHAGRDMGGFAGQLAKATGNALWGQFVISHGERTIQAWRDGSRKCTKIPTALGRPRAYDLGEYVTGIVRAKLFGFMEAAGERLLCAHTDGGWVRVPEGDTFEMPGWRRKGSAVEFRLVGPQTFSYREPTKTPTPLRWHFVVSGFPPSLARITFNRQWKDYASE